MSMNYTPIARAGKTLGASEVKSARKVSVAASTTRVTLATPASGKKIRITSAQVQNSNTTASRIEVYFGTGANINTNPGKEIMDPVLDFDTQLSYSMAWPEGGGPVGAVDEVVSFRTGAGISTSAVVTIHYREE